MAFESNITATNTGGSDATKVIWNYGSAPDLDPFGYIAAWLARLEEAVQDTINAYPNGASSFQQNYDGMYCYWKVAQLTANTTLANDAMQLTKNTSDTCAATWPELDNGPLDSFSAGITQGFYNYNGGFRTLATDPWLDPADYDTTRQRCVNWARGTAYSNHTQRLLYCRVWSEDLWPNDPNYYTADSALRPPGRCRERALSILSHVMSDDWYREFEQRDYGGGYTWADGHDDYPARVAEDYFCYPGGALDQWIDITAELDAANGNFALVPRTWRENGYEYTPFMWAHSARALIYYLEDNQMNAKKDITSQVIESLRVLCDTSINYWRVNLGGHTAVWGLAYEVRENNYPTQAAGDLALFHMPMFAWLWSKTGDDRYYQMAVELVECGLTYGYFPVGKQSNQQTIWAYAGFQWLGWTPDQFAVWWRDNP